MQQSPGRRRKAGPGPWIAVAALVAAAAAGDEFERLRARIQEVPPAAVTETAWREWEAELRALERRAEQAGDGDRLRAVALFTARVQASDRRDPSGALRTLREARERLAALRPPGDARALFLAEAEVLAGLGDREGIRRLMADYRASPWHTPSPPVFRGGRGPDDPLRVYRPHAAGHEDAVLTAMERHARAAQAAPGQVPPAFRLRDIEGRVHTPEAWRGRVLLIDFGVHGAQPWEAGLPARIRAWRQWRDEGFGILTVHQNRNTDGIRAWLRRHPEAGWSHVARDEAQELLAALGIFGEPRNLLLDAEGRIRARDVTGPGLSDAVRRALGRPAPRL